jgi:hypothetical protein
VKAFGARSRTAPPIGAVAGWMLVKAMVVRIWALCMSASPWRRGSRLGLPAGDSRRYVAGRAPRPGLVVGAGGRSVRRAAGAVAGAVGIVAGGGEADGLG